MCAHVEEVCKGVCVCVEEEVCKGVCVCVCGGGGV